MEFNIGTPEAIWLSVTLIGATIQTYGKFNEKSDMKSWLIDTATTIAILVCEVAVLAWGGFFS